MEQLSGVSIVLRERLLFFKRWLDNPLQLGALAPSSRALSDMVTRQVLADNGELLEKGYYILELGAGTGVFTASLLEAGLPPNQLISVELDPHLHNHLQHKFPDVHVIQGDACNLEAFLPEASRGKIASVVSGIPMVTVPQENRSQIVHAVFRVMVDGGRMYQFTYSPFSSIQARNFNLRKHRLGTVFRNFPPATVWCYESLPVCS